MILPSFAMLSAKNTLNSMISGVLCDSHYLKQDGNPYNGPSAILVKMKPVGAGWAGWAEWTGWAHWAEWAGWAEWAIRAGWAEWAGCTPGGTYK